MSRRPKGASNSHPVSPPMLLDIESVDLDGQGVARSDGKVLFVENALPGERVLARVTKHGARFDRAQTIEVIRASAGRVHPRCAYFGICGGCSMQHMDADTQLAIKQRVLEDQLWHLARVKPKTMLAAISGPAWNYRHRARLSVRDVQKKGEVLVGFHEKGSSYVAQMDSCEVLSRQASELIPKLKRLVESLSIRQRVPQIEVAQGGKVLALVFRVLQSPSDEDVQRFMSFAEAHSIEVWLQVKGPDSIQLLYPNRSNLSYGLSDFNLHYPFLPTDFTQVNHQVNEVLVRKAVRLLNIQPDDQVLDLFCGLGNFSLALARSAARVVGIESSESLIRRAKLAAQAQGLCGRADFEVANLFDINGEQWERFQGFKKMLVDPPREGAQRICELIASQALKPDIVVYVSCNPATLARDVAILVHQGGFELEAAGVANMFPQTSHVESVAVFRNPAGRPS